MSWLSRVANVFRSERLDHDLREEAQFHLAARTEDLVRKGMKPEEAERRAQKLFGNQLLLRESSRDIKLLPWLESLVRDTKLAARMLARNPTLSAAAVVSLSLAIGACTAAFSLIDALILRSLPVHEPSRLFYVTYPAHGREGSEEDASSFNYPLFERMRDAGAGHVRLFGLSYQSLRRATFDDAGGQEERIYAQWISGDAFAILDIHPAAGRLFSQAHDLKPGRHPVAVLSYDFWSRRFGRNPAVLGRWLTLQNRPLQIIGVAERGFTGVEPGTMTDVWVPNMMWQQEALTNPGWSWFRIWGRLKEGATQAQTQAVLQTVFTNFRRERSAATSRPDEPRSRVEAYIKAPIHLRSAANGPSTLRRQFERPLWVVAVVAGLVLLIACSNVASLFSARAAARDREMALRMSIGAGRGRLIQQMLVESGLISVMACFLGALFAIWVAPSIVAMLSTSQRMVRFDLHFDWRIFLFLAAVGGLTNFLFGSAPALRASGTSPADALKFSGGKQSARIGMFKPIVAAQAAFSFMVLFIGGLFLLSFANVSRINPGFDPAGLVLVDIEARDLQRGDAKSLALWQQVRDRLGEVPGIKSASLSGWGLFSGSGWTQYVRIPGSAPEPLEPYFLGVSPRFLETMRIRLLDGRDFEPRDAEPEKPSSVIINQAFARHYFPGVNPIGKRFFRVDGRDTLVPQDVVGLAGDAKYDNLREATPPTVYVPFRPSSYASAQIRTGMDPAALARTLREKLPQVHPAFRITEITLQSTLIDATLIRDRLLALLSAFFAVIAIVLASVGIYGVLSYMVVQRTKEIGIRVALGARQLRIARLVVSDIALFTVVGLVVGLGCGFLLSRFISILLFEVKPTDSWSVALPLAFLLLASGLAAVVPAVRAARVDPMTALRYE